MSLAKFAKTNAYISAVTAGLDHDEAKRRAREAQSRVAADVAIDDPVRAAFDRVYKEKSMLGAEAVRLRRERDALLRALAHALNTTESEAWLIARLDLEEDQG